jgi:hypothetical protein
MTIAKLLVACTMAVWSAAGTFAAVSPEKSIHSSPAFSSPVVTTQKTLQESSTAALLAQGLCRRFIGEYVSHDHAIRIQNDIRSRGFHAWIEHRGCITCNPDTRTYVVWAMLPCR